MEARAAQRLSALQGAVAQGIQEDNIAKIRQKYRSIDTYDKASKIQAVKDTSLNPFLFEDPFDGLVNSYSRWAQEAPAFAGRDEKTKLKVAGDYYDQVLAPFYQHMKVTPLNRDVWLSQAWGQALKYQPEQSYHSAVVHGLIEGIPGAITSLARAGQFIQNTVGLPVAAFADSIKNGDYSGLTGFANLYINMHNRVSKEGFFKGLESVAENAPLIGAGSKFYKDIANYNSFWHDVTPNRTFTEKATSFIAENALLLPLFKGLSIANEAGIGLLREASKGVPVVENLTTALNASPAGRFAQHFLTSGTEGLMWGLLTRQNDDKSNAWEDALTFAAMGSLFSLLPKKGVAPAATGTITTPGVVQSGAGRVDATPRQRPDPRGLAKPTVTLDAQRIDRDRALVPTGPRKPPPREGVLEIVPEGGQGFKLSELLPAGEERKLLEAGEQNALVRSRGEHIASYEEALDAHRTEMAYNIATGGMSVQHAIFEEALLHVASIGEHIDTPETQAFMQRAVKTDPAHFKPMFSAVQLIMRFLKEHNFSTDIVKHPEQHEQAYLGLINFLKEESSRAAREVELRVPEVRESGARRMVQEVLKTPEGQVEFKEEVEKAVTKYKGDPKGVEKAFKDAEKAMVEKRVAFTKRAVEAKEVTGAANAGEAPPSQRVESHYEYDEEGHPTAYQMSISYNWKVAKENLARSQGFSTRSSRANEFWQRFVDSTTGQTDDPETGNKAFIEDLRTYFNPLKSAGLRFEKGSKSGGEVAGGDYTNFLGFIYHYKENLPEPVRAKVEEILMNSPKMYKLLGERPSIEKLDHFGQAIQNHVDMFMRSKWYRENMERHVFRSSQPGIKTATKWQLDLVENTRERDLKKANAFYPGRSRAELEAKEAYKNAINLFYSQEITAMKSGNAKKLAEVMSKVRERISKERQRARRK